MRLFLMRHAHTELPGHNKDDLTRVLTLNGRDQAEEASAFLADYQIDKVIVSYAKRTMQTLNIVQEKINTNNVEIVEELYQNDIRKVLDLVSSQYKENSHILVIGHNPCIFDLALSLIDNNSAKYDLLTTTMMPTGRIIVIDFNNSKDWKSILSTKGDIENIFTPNSK